MSAGRPVGANEIPTWTSLGKRLRDLRHERQISQDDLAAASGLHGAEQISRYELGKEMPRLNTLAWIARALGVDDMGEMLAGIRPEDLV